MPWPPDPSAAASAETWAWTDAGSADTALVDRLCAIWTDHDVASIGDVYADDARMVFRSMGQPGDLTMIRQGVQGSPDAYEREGNALVATPPASASLNPSGGSRFLFFRLRVTGAGTSRTVGSWLELDRSGRITMEWEDATR